VVGRGKRDWAAVQNRFGTETGYAERDVLTQRGHVASVEGLALAREFGADRVADIACPFVLCWCGRVECWEVGAGAEWARRC
jgi:hypothetical protein